LFKDGSFFNVDVEGRYNLSDLNNLEAVGYDNLKERAANLSKTKI
jgi:hypothetical protein